MAFILKSGTKVPLAFEIVDVDGNAVVQDFPPSWSSSDPAVVTVDESGMATDPVGAGLGTATITASGSGFTAVIDITTVSGDAAFANISAGTAEPR